jgi:hypothetical protein
MKVADQALDMVRQITRYDMSRSASRFRRRLYAQWRSPLVLNELVGLTKEGYGLRPAEPEPLDVGDVLVDQWRLVAIIKGWGAPPRGAPKDVKDRLNPQDRVVALQCVMNALVDATYGDKTPVSDVEAAVLWSLHLSEGAKKVRKDQVAQNAGRHLPKWGLYLPSPMQLETVVKLLEERGYIKSEGASWRITDVVTWPF